MARGWESKDIESQIEEAEAARTKIKHHQTLEEVARRRERESLELSRVRVLRDLEQSKNPRYQAILKQALEHLDQRLAEVSLP